MFINEVQASRKIYGPKGQSVIEGWKKLHNRRFIIVVLTKYC